MFQSLFGSAMDDTEVNDEDLEQEALREIEEKARREPRIDPIILRPVPSITAAQVYGPPLPPTPPAVMTSTNKSERGEEVQEATSRKTIQGPQLLSTPSIQVSEPLTESTKATTIGPSIPASTVPPSVPLQATSTLRAPSSVVFVPKSQRTSVSTASNAKTIVSSKRGPIGASSVTSKSSKTSILSFDMDDSDNNDEKETTEDGNNEDCFPTIPLPPSLLAKKLPDKRITNDSDDSDDEAEKAKRRRMANMKSRKQNGNIVKDE